MPSEGVEFVPRKELLTYDEIDRIIAVFVGLGVNKIRISGGEPTVRKDIVELIRRVGKHSLRSFAMTTNGYLLNDLAEEFRQAGLQRINISLDSLRSDRFREMVRFDGFEKVWSAIWKAYEVGLSPVKINMVVMRGINDDEIRDFVELTRCTPFHVRFIEYMPSSGDLGNRFSDSRVMKVDEIRAHIEAVYPIHPITEAMQTGPAKLYAVDGFEGKIGFIDPYSQHFCSTCNRVRLTSLGRLKWCLFSNEGLDLRSFIRSGHSDDELSAWIRERIVVDKPEHHPVALPDMVRVNTVFSQVGG
jgi:cyclic pyranopterin phosphate synthase